MNDVENAAIRNAADSHELSKLRLNLMRVLFLLTFLGLAPHAWREIIGNGEMDPMYGVAFSFWAAYAVLMLLGVRYPVKMLPLLMLQLFYKSVWLIWVAYPLWIAGRLESGTTGMLKNFITGVVLDLIVIPWPYVMKNYVKELFRFRNPASL